MHLINAAVEVVTRYVKSKSKSLNLIKVVSADVNLVKNFINNSDNRDGLLPETELVPEFVYVPALNTQGCIHIQYISIFAVHRNLRENVDFSPISNRVILYLFVYIETMSIVTQPLK